MVFRMSYPGIIQEDSTLESKELRMSERSTSEISIAGGRSGRHRKARVTGDRALWHIVLAAIASGTIIAVYVLLVSRINSTHPSRMPVRYAAELAAKELKQITLSHSSFGEVGMLDSLSTQDSGSHSDPRMIRSVNSIKASILSAAIFARRLRQEIMIRQIDRDVESLEQLEQDLLEEIFRAVESPESRDANTSPDLNVVSMEGRREGNRDRGSIYKHVYSFIQQNTPSSKKLVSVNVELGRYEGEDVKLAAPMASPSLTGSSYAEGGRFKADLPLFVTDKHFMSFYPTASETRIVTPDKFIAAAKGVTPSAVLVEATFDVKDAEGNSKREKKLSCITLGNETLAPARSCMVLRFPHGLPSRFSSVRKLLEPGHWIANGEWEQASGGPVPGAGQLKPTIEPVLPAMMPGEALSLCLYHWIRQMHPAPDPEALVSLLDATLHMDHQEETSTPQSTLLRINSCLARDTGARERALIKGTGPRSKGQEALAACFRGNSEETEFPQESVPLYVDGDGNLNLASRSTMDEKLIREFFDSVYDTNIAALESLAISSRVLRKARADVRAITHKIMLREQEEGPLRARLNRLEAEEGKITKSNDRSTLQSLTTRPPSESDRIRSKLNTAQTESELDRQRRQELNEIIELATRAKNNAHSAAMRTFEITSGSLVTLKGGLHKFDAPHNAYLLGRRLVFFPIPEPLQEEEIIIAAKRRIESESPSEDESRWFNRRMKLAVEWQQAFPNSSTRSSRPELPKINGKPLSAVVSEVEFVKQARPLTVTFEAHELLSSTSVVAHRASDYPFSGLPTPAGQNFYYCKTALTTGANPLVDWSVAIRDAVCHQIEGSAGRPLMPEDTQWGRKMNPQLEQSSGMAIEFQLRRPLPRIESGFAGAYITDPIYGRKIPQLPPVPPTLM